MAGRKPKPTKLKIIQGNPGKRPLNKNEPEPEILKKINPPSFLTPCGKTKYIEISKKLMKLGLLSEIDTDALELYCTTYERWLGAVKIIKKSGIYYKDSKGITRQSPFNLIAEKSQKLMQSLLAEFGMTPSSRSKVSVQKSNKSSEFDFLD